ncbi:MAG TPA: hypothetical protein P5280_02860 [Cyclobacteriaceae bacterium]|nr:hypothetical protein [Cyclobacteriaceae bacterium]
MDENGEPLPVWHITNEDFTKFEASKARQNADIPAFYFATNKDDWKDMGSKAMPVGGVPCVCFVGFCLGVESCHPLHFGYKQGYRQYNKPTNTIYEQHIIK